MFGCCGMGEYLGAGGAVGKGGGDGGGEGRRGFVNDCKNDVHA